MTVTTALETTATVEELDAEVRTEMAVIEDAKPAKLTKDQKEALKREQEAAEREALRAEIRALVPWKVDDLQTDWNSKNSDTATSKIG
jgi:hypothetical protein